MMIYKKGSKGWMVKQIQKQLRLIPDGIYGILTEEAVRDFQTVNGLKADGICGPATLSLMGLLVVSNLKKSGRYIKEIIVHCTATQEGRETTVEEIRSWHKKQGWKDIGYHYVVYLDGSIHNGRDVDLVGSHCRGHNTGSIGVVYVGGVAKDGVTPKDTRTEAQKVALRGLMYELKAMYPDAKIFGHRDFSSKACPSFDARAEYYNI